MSAAAWRAFAEELARWRDAGREVDFWWRDDDAARPDPALERLLALATGAGIPLALAVVPLAADPALLERLEAGIDILQHGTDHRDRAARGEKKTEFPAAEPAEAALARLAAGRGRLAALCGARPLEVLAPPWNRMPQTLVARLREAGFGGVSRYGARAAAEAAPGLREVNAHVDLVAWRGDRGFIGEEQALGLAVRHLAARRAGAADPGEPTGWLTHHACHEEAAWRFLGRLVEATAGAPGVRWRSAAELFGTR
jgi:hypothetical protein